MTALEIKITKNFMNALLVSEKFDAFLVEDASVTTFNTFEIDGHIVKDFYTSEEIEAAGGALPVFSQWKDIRPICFQLIKGKKTPVSFKVVLHASPELTAQIAQNPECGVDASLIRSLGLNIRYDKGRVTCVTGTAFTTFIMDKSVDALWDQYIRSFLAEAGLDFEESGSRHIKKAYHYAFFTLGLNMRLARYPNISAALHPTAPLVKPPLKRPINPSLSTASLMPFMRIFP